MSSFRRQNLEHIWLNGFLTQFIKMFGLSLDWNQGSSPFNSLHMRSFQAKAADHYKKFLVGMVRYQTYSRRRIALRAPVIWQQGSTKVYEYGGGGSAKSPIIFIPSLINRSYIFDLHQKASLMRYLAKEGVSSWLISWGKLTPQERTFALQDYIDQRILPLIEKASSPPILVGYCMGGLLALAAAQQSAKVKGLVLLATPWDFRAHPWSAFVPLWGDFLSALIEAYQELPKNFLQMLFWFVNPFQVMQKFVQFGQGALQENPKTSHFIKVENWLNDVLALAPAVAQECLFHWFGNNLPYQGKWTVGNTVIQPESLDIPTLFVIPQRDQIVPPASALSLTKIVKNSHILRPMVGHVGLLTSQQAVPQVWAPLKQFLQQV